jgi:hypothetical protein
MIFYHGTTEQKWKQIQKDGYLLGVTENGRFTFLTPEIEVAKEYGDVILKTDYDIINNCKYVEKLAWYQYIIHQPININQIERVI